MHGSVCVCVLHSNMDTSAGYWLCWVLGFVWQCSVIIKGWMLAFLLKNQTCYLGFSSLSTTRYSNSLQKDVTDHFVAEGIEHVLQWMCELLLFPLSLWSGKLDLTGALCHIQRFSLCQAPSAHSSPTPTASQSFSHSAVTALPLGVCQKEEDAECN